MKESMSGPESTNGMPRLMFYCQHSLGLGHLVRSTELVLGLGSFHVTFVNAGDVIEGFKFPSSVEVINLPQLNIDDDCRHIQGNGAESAPQAVKVARRKRLHDVWQDTHPEILVIELFPFGRKKFEFELLPLLEEIRRTKSSTKVVCSLRDILVHRNDQPQWEERVCEIANTYFDLILIHSDPRFQRLEESFGRVSDLRCALRYTGFVAQLPHGSDRYASEPLRLPDDGRPLIVVSIGGGRIGAELLSCSIEASARIRDTLTHHMTVVTGPHFPDAEWPRIRQLADMTSGVTLLRYTGRLIDYFAHADLSISLAGYNTCMNILITGVPSLVYPITGYNKDEQITRASKLEGLGVVSVIRPEELNPETLGQKILSSLHRQPARTDAALDTQGVANTARLLTNLIGGDFERAPATLTF